MKKALLLIGSVVVSLSASAQNFTGKWERPADPEFSDFEPETKYYMWNVGAKGFYINHQNGTGEPYYGTAASVNDTIGALVHFTKTNPDEKIVEAWEPGTDNTYLLVSVVSTKKNQELCTFADPDYRVWTDNNTKGYRYFDVAVNGKTFTITPNPTMIQMVVAGELPADYAYNPLGVESTNVNKIVNTSHGEGEWYTDWAFVTEEAYEAYLSSAKEQIKRCAAAEALRKTIENAVKEYPGINLDNQVDVYNNTNSTLEELTAAKEAISDVVVAFTASKATIDNPVNYTSLIKNSTFDVLGNFDGWSNTGSVTFGAGGTYKSTNAEVYGKAFDIYQTVKGLPTGVYIAKVNAYFRKEGAQKDYDDYTAGVQSDCNFYAQSGVFKSSVSIKHVAEGGVKEAFGVNDEVTFETNDGVTMYVPNSMLAADSYFHNEDGTINPRYENVIYVPVTNGELTIGVANSVGGGSDWSIFDDFQLYYIGEGDKCYELLRDNLEKALEYTLPEKTAYSTRDYADYINAKNAFKSATGKAALTEYTNAAAALETVKAGIENYKLYQAAVTNANEWYSDAKDNGINEEIPAVEKLYSYLNDDEDAADFGFPNGTAAQILNSDNEGSLTNEQIIAETDYVNGLVEQAVNDGIFEGADLTSKITNPGFEISGGKGWSTGSLGTPNNWYGGNNNNHCAEAWNRNFDVYQDVEGLPNGLYEVSVQAFYRTGTNADSYEAFQNDPEMKNEAKVLSYVYLNEFATPIRNVMEIQFDENLANNCFQTPASTYTLNGMASASEAFSLDDESQNFTMKVYGIITDGKMRLGIRGEGTTFDRWTLWDNFRLRYMGKNKVAVASVLKTKADALLAMEDEVDEAKKSIMNNYTKKFIDDQYVAAMTLLSGISEFNDNTLKMLNEDDLWNALTNIGAAQVEVDADVKAYKTFRSAYEKFDLYNTDNLTTEMLNEYRNIQIASEDYENMTRQQLDELTARINKALFWYGHDERFNQAVEVEELPEGYDTATGDVDFTSIIVNPDFEDDLNGWNNENMQPQNNSAFGKNGEKYCEKWHADLSLSITQSFKNLPNGFYTLTAHCYNSTADGCLFISAEDDNANYIEDAKFIEDTTTPETVATYSVTVELKGGILTLGARATLTSSTWFCVDNFKLTYSKEAPATAVETVETAETSATAGIYTISGARVDKLTKGINIVKMANGTVKKVFVK
jgi:hypothetical protein